MSENTWVPRMRRGGAELLVIVVGVLIALWADAWRETYSDRQQMRVYLGELSAELTEVTARLSESISLDSINKLRADELAVLLRGGLGNTSPDSARARLQLGYSTYVPGLPTLELLVATSDLRLIRTPSLRAQMRNAASEVERTAATVESTMQRLNETYGAMAAEAEELWWASAGDTPSTIPRFPLHALAFDEPRRLSGLSALVTQYAISLNIRTNRKRALRAALGDLHSSLVAERGDS